MYSVIPIHRKIQMRVDLTKELLYKELITNKLSIGEFISKYNTTRITIIRKTKKYDIYKLLELERKSKKKNLLGCKFGKLLVIDSAKNSPQGRSRWLCECECGRKKNIDTTSLTRKLSQSCGYCTRCNFKGYEDISGIYLKHTKNSADKRGIKYDISAKDIWEIYLLQNRKCAISGLPIIFVRNYDKQVLQTASIDRIDSKKDYTRDNIQIVHKKINNMKQWLDNDEFLYFCKLAYLNCKDNIPDNFEIKKSWRKNANF